MPDRWDVVATLVDPSRRALFEFVRRQDQPVGREQAARATGMSRGLAAFHLDKLVEAGLLAARYQAPAGPRGRGRTPKVYSAVADVTIAIPARRDDLIADLLASAHLEKLPPTEVAYRQGRGHRVADLGALGFEPRESADLILFGNCPFRELAARHRPLICQLAVAFVDGLASGAPGYQAVPSPQPGGCCVALRRRPDAESPGTGLGSPAPGG